MIVIQLCYSTPRSGRHVMTPDSSQTESDVSPVITRKKKLSAGDVPTLSVQADDTSPRMHHTKGTSLRIIMWHFT